MARPDEPERTRVQLQAALDDCERREGELRETIATLRLALAAWVAALEQVDAPTRRAMQQAYDAVLADRQPQPG